MVLGLCFFVANIKNLQQLGERKQSAEELHFSKYTTSTQACNSLSERLSCQIYKGLGLALHRKPSISTYPYFK